MKIIIRQEQADDAEAIHQLTIAAFLEAAHTDHTEQFVVKALREAQQLSVSLVAEYNREIIGHIAVSPVVISDGASNWYGIGPLSVLPTQQRQGVGSKLMRRVLTDLQALNAAGCVLLGDPAYYYRFGFKPIKSLVLADVPAEYFQALSFSGQFPSGEVRYHSAFSATS
ncbi:GNAT family N-acetyltransferase [Oceanicoccus sp. KOV_DT_Chl]|uniref:GNAT family N-acetyltransferase n=1 Tax=Oceanicoccus sp. KOV_DT_Chl TaxID=1904639 RepID=UPI000C7B3419|nr:N-acetyltransferase [Oceanicoccus sp. KOV_DT_Chl]